jgi:hypothetical protein
MRLIMRLLASANTKLATACSRSARFSSMRVPLDAGDNTGHQPARLAHLNDWDECTFLVEISE